jgi:hypothetical protein
MGLGGGKRHSSANKNLNQVSAMSSNRVRASGIEPWGQTSTSRRWNHQALSSRGGRAYRVLTSSE